MNAKHRKSKNPTNMRPAIQSKAIGFRPATKKRVRKFTFWAVLILLTFAFYDIYRTEIHQSANTAATDTWHKVTEKTAETKRSIYAKMPQNLSFPEVSLPQVTSVQKPAEQKTATETTNATTISARTPFFKRPSTFSKPVGFLEQGIKLIISEEKNNWVKIKGDGLWIRRSDLAIKDQV